MADTRADEDVIHLTMTGAELRQLKWGVTFLRGLEDAMEDDQRGSSGRQRGRAVSDVLAAVLARADFPSDFMEFARLTDKANKEMGEALAECHRVMQEVGEELRDISARWALGPDKGLVRLADRLEGGRR